MVRTSGQPLEPTESRVPVTWHARFGKHHRVNTGQAVRPYADFAHTTFGPFTYPHLALQHNGDEPMPGELGDTLAGQKTEADYHHRPGGE